MAHAGKLHDIGFFYGKSAYRCNSQVMDNSQKNESKTPRTRRELISSCSRYLVAIIWWSLVGVYGSRSQAQDTRANATDSKDNSAVDMTLEQLQRYYFAELTDLEYNASQDQLDSLLRQVGERVEAFFSNFSNTASKEQVRMQRLGNDGREEDYAKQDFYYLILPHSGGKAASFEEVRTDKKGRQVNPAATRGFFISTGYAGVSLYFHPDHHFGSYFRYLGRQTSEPRAHVIAFAQKPEVKDYLAGYSGPESKDVTPLLFQGIAWIDPQSFQITRLRTDLLTPHVLIGLLEQKTDIRFSEVRFTASQLPMWLPKEVTISCTVKGITYRNQHRYSDYKVFSVESYDKINPPEVKK
jgi:hypothetical protein